MKITENTFKQALIHCDGESTDTLQDFYSQYSGQKFFLKKLVDWLKSPELELPSSWLIKHHCEQGEAHFTVSQCQTILQQMMLFEQWQSKLHILQCLSFIAISEESCFALAQSLHQGLTDNNKFIRAWSYHGYYCLANVYPQYRQQVKDYFSMAMRDEAASVKAHIRQLIKASDWLSV